MKNSQIMIHQVLGGAEGQASDIEIEAMQIMKIKERLNTILAENTGRSVEEVTADTERNNWMFPEDALEYGIIDHVIGLNDAEIPSSENA